MGVLKNEVPRWIAFGVWILIQIILFGVYFRYYQTEPSYEYLRRILGVAFPFARAPTYCIKFNCMLILLPVCRNLISFTRRVLCKCCIRSLKRLLDKSIKFHKLLAYSICFWTAVHTIAHCYNLQFYVRAQQANPNIAGSQNVTVYQLSSLGAGSCPTSYKKDSWLNPVCTPDSSPVLELFKLLPTISGVITTLSLLVIVLSATEFIRRSYFEVFWLTHHLFVIFFVFLILHGFHGVIRSQQPNGHNTTLCSTIDFNDWGSDSRCPLPQFKSNTPSTWHWLIVPIAFYVLECIVRLYRSFQNVTIIKTIKHPSNVIELQMKKTGFTMLAGQYVFIKCSSISRIEWHPFTLTSSPEEDFFSVHIRIAGDWTEALSKAIDLDGSASPLTIAVDGPFGTASEDWDQYEVDVLIGAGIGVTPFASIMKHMWYTYIQSIENNRGSCKLKKVYFYWICPDTNVFEWFSDLLQHLERQTVEKGCSEFLSYNIFLTRGWDENFATNVALHEGESVDAVTGLQQKTHYGRPNWDQIFTRLKETHPDISTGVFFCGPSSLSNTLHKMCNLHSAAKTQFVYNKENF